MWAEFKHTLSRLRGQIIGWAIGIALYSIMMAFLYPTVTGIEDLTQLYASFPEEMMVFFGDIMMINTPRGYLDTYFFSYMQLIVGILAISVGASLLVGDEERGILDLVLAHPVSRTALFWGRLLGLAVALIVVLLAGWLSWAIPAGSVGLGLGWIELLWPFLPLLSVLMLFATLALLLSMLLPAGRIAGMLTGALLVGNFLLSGLAKISPDLEPVVDLTPLRYYQGGQAVEGLNWGWVAGLLAVALLLSAGAWLLFRRRDIRVGGERSWKLPRLIPRRARSQSHTIF
ncbi:MAG TPA: ABC transporter permease subunit [Anaerolineae bacterium]|nr:ABC transporter permease subunit [Anaerolineae bacterium]